MITATGDVIKEPFARHAVAGAKRREVVRRKFASGAGGIWEWIYMTGFL